MVQSKFPSVQTTAQASVRQIVLQLFDRVAADSSAGTHYLQPVFVFCSLSFSVCFVSRAILMVLNFLRGIAAAAADTTPHSRRGAIPDGLGPHAADAYAVYQVRMKRDALRTPVSIVIQCTCSFCFNDAISYLTKMRMLNRVGYLFAGLWRLPQVSADGKSIWRVCPRVD